MYREGTVHEVDAERPRARVQFADGMVSPWLSVLQRNTLTNQDYGVPDVGELVACLLDAGEEHGCILGAVYTATNVPPDPNPEVRRVTFGDGTVVEYDRENSVLHVACAGDTQLECDIEITRTLTVAGAAELQDSLQVAGGAAALTRDDLIQQALTQLKNAIASATPGSMDGGIGLKSTLMAALAAWPPSTGAQKVSSD